MNLILDATSEMRIQRELERGHYREPAEVVAQALALLEDQEDWLVRDKDAMNQRLDESCAKSNAEKASLRMKCAPSWPRTAFAASGEPLPALSHALADLRTIIEGRAGYFGSESAEELEEELLAVFSRVAAIPGLGHRRSDLTPKPYLFYTVEPNLIVYLREVDPLPIIGVLHGARDVRKLLKKRLLT